MGEPILKIIEQQLPDGWFLTAIHLDYNTGQWEVTAWDDYWIGHAVMKQGNTLDEALALAHKAANDGDYWAPNAQRSALASVTSDLFSLIGLKPKAEQPPVKRRSIP